jgi:hypothetical protein
MISERWVTVSGLIWLLGWGFLVLRFPVQSLRVLAWGRKPRPRQLRLACVVGYMGLGFGALILVEIAVGLVSFR